MQRLNQHAYASHTPIISQLQWSASQPSSFAMKSQKMFGLRGLDAVETDCGLGKGLQMRC